jgi:hypothetical protein
MLLPCLCRPCCPVLQISLVGSSAGNPLGPPLSTPAALRLGLLRHREIPFDNLRKRELITHCELLQNLERFGRAGQFGTGWDPA